MPKLDQPVPPRIGSGNYHLISGWVLLGLGVVIGIGSAGSTVSGSGSGLAGAAIAIGVTLIVIGFWVRLFGQLERRLIDIEQRLAPEPPPPQPTSTSAPLPSEAYLG